MGSPSDIKRIVCLANSRKERDRCIAGKELLGDGQFGAWIRPVSNRKTEAVSKSERHYEDGSEPRLLDVIDVPVLNAQPRDYQQENWLLDRKRKWRKSGSIRRNALTDVLDPVSPLWVNGYHSYNRLNDRTPLDEANRLGNVRTSRLPGHPFLSG